MELVIGSIFLSQREAIAVPSSLTDALFGLCISRIALMGLMVALLVPWQCRRQPKAGPADESQSLLESSHGPAASYGGSNGSASGNPTQKARDAQSTGWLDYFAGFQILFPYLW